MGINNIENEKYREKELENCTFIKTILMVIIVIYHSMLFWNGTWFNVIQPVFSAPLLKYITEWLSTFHTYTFVVVSGYIFYHIKFEKLRYNSFKEFILKKVNRLLIPYLFVSLVWVIPITIHFYGLSIPETLNRFVLGTSPSQLWFLLMLFIVFSICYWLSERISNNNLIACFICIFCYLAGVLGQHYLPNYYQIFTGLRYILYFVLGMKIRQLNIASAFAKRKRLIILVVVYLAELLLFFMIKNIESRFFMVLRVALLFILNLSGSFCAFIILQIIGNKLRYSKSKTFAFISKKSMSIYLFHQQIIYFVILYSNGRINPYLNALLNFIVCSLLSLALSSALYQLKITRFLIGEK